MVELKDKYKTASALCCSGRANKRKITASALWCSGITRNCFGAVV